VPSGKKSKQARRAAATATVPPVSSKGGRRVGAKPPPVVSKGGTRRREANPKVLGIVGGVVLVAVLAIVLGVVFTRGGGSKIDSSVPAVGSLANGLPGASDVAAMYKGVPQKGLFLGSPFAPVQMVMYIDLQCPRCQEFETASLPTIVQKYVRSGKLRIQTKPWAFIGPDSVRGQEAMLAAAKQNKAYNFASVLYDNQGTENTGWLDDNMIASIAASVPGLKVHKLLADRSSGDVGKQVQSVAAAAEADKVSGTPTIFVGKNGAKPAMVGAAGYIPTLGQVETAVQNALSG
jgi:protein-disulfide isomerase